MHACRRCAEPGFDKTKKKASCNSLNRKVLQRQRISRCRESIQMQGDRYAEPMLHKRWDEIVPADDDAGKRGSRVRLAGSSEGLDAKSWCFDLLVCRHALILSSIEKVLALVRDECPLRESAAGVATGCRRFARGLNAADCFIVDVLLLKQELRGKR